MPLLSGIFGGMLCGLVPAAIFGFLSVLPYMGWAEYAILPAFYLAAIPCGVLIGLKTSRLQ